MAVLLLIVPADFGALYGLIWLGLPGIHPCFRRTLRSSLTQLGVSYHVP